MYNIFTPPPGSCLWGIKAVSALRQWLLRWFSSLCPGGDCVVGFTGLQICLVQGGTRQRWVTLCLEPSELQKGPWPTRNICIPLLCVWMGCIGLHVSPHPQQEFTCSVPPFPTIFVLWLSDSVREVLPPPHRTGGGSAWLGCRTLVLPPLPCLALQAGVLISCSGVSDLPDFFYSVVCAAWLSFCLKKPWETSKNATKVHKVQIHLV